MRGCTSACGMAKPAHLLPIHRLVELRYRLELANGKNGIGSPHHKPPLLVLDDLLHGRTKPTGRGKPNCLLLADCCGKNLIRRINRENNVAMTGEIREQRRVNFYIHTQARQKHKQWKRAGFLRYAGVLPNLGCDGTDSRECGAKRLSQSGFADLTDPEWPIRQVGSRRSRCRVGWVIGSHGKRSRSRRCAENVRSTSVRPNKGSAADAVGSRGPG